MKKLISLVLTLILLLAFVACEDKNSGNADNNANDTNTENSGETAPDNDDEKIPDNDETAPENGDGNNAEEELPTSLLAAAEKLKTASSYHFAMIADADEEIDDGIVEYYVTKNGDGTGTFQNKNNKGRGKREKEFSYYEGNVGYKYEASSMLTDLVIIDKVVFDVPVTMEVVLLYEEGIESRYDENSMLALFDGMKPTATKEDNGVLLQVENMTKEQLQTLYAALVNDPKVAEEFNEMPVTDFFFNGRIDNNGYLKEVVLSITCEMEGAPVTEEFKFIIDQVNSTEIETPDYVKNFKLRSGASVEYINNGQTTGYYCDGGITYNGETFQVVFCGFLVYYYDAYVVEQYKVLSEVEGFPVTAVNGVLDNSFSKVKVKRIIIPSGMEFDPPSDIDPETEIYFEDTEQQAKIDFTNLKDNKSIYYGGQWEYVDGIATPKK